MARHSGWTIWECALATIYGLMCIVVGVFAFIEIYLTVTHLLHSSMGDWAWIVPASAEGLFTALYAGWMLLELRDSPPPAVVWLLGALLAVAVGGSYWLNIYAARGAVPDAVAHVIVVTAFYGVLLFAKVLVRRLKVTPAERALEAGMAHARQYAIDLVRAVRGRWWRWNVPSLLRRQILSGRLCDAVREDVRMKVSVGRTSGWEETVRGWVFGPDGLALAAVASEASRLALSAVARDAREDTSASAPGSPSGSTAEPSPGDASATPARNAPASASAKPRRLVPSKASDDELADIIVPLLGDGEWSATRVVKVIREETPGKGSVGHKRAGDVLELAHRRAKQVVSIGDRKQA